MYKPTYNPFNNRYLTNGFRKLSYFSFRNYFFILTFFNTKYLYRILKRVIFAL